MAIQSHSSSHAEHHIMPLATYLKVAGALFVLTFLTVGFHALREHIGAAAPLIAFSIAAVKAFLVMAWFMHLKYENLMNRVIFATGFVFLALLFLISIIDIYSRVTVNSVLQFVFKTFSQLTKFGIVVFVLLAGVAGYATGFFIESTFDYKHLITFIGGLYFLSSGSLALNQVQEWKLDQKMNRTKNRPIASGKIKPMAGGILAFAMLFAGVNLLFSLSTVAGLIAVVSVIMYNVLYTLWWKPNWIFAAVPGAIPGALPVTIGYAVNNPNIFTSESIYLFLIMFLWQMPHFWTLAIKYKDDYAAGGIPTLPTVLGVHTTLFHVGLYTFAYAGVAIASPFFLHTSWFHAFFVFPFAYFLLKEFFRVYKSDAKERWFAFFMWTNVSMLVFIFVPAIDKWSFLFIGRG